ncbi:DUF4350 domain-containing protein [Haloarcula marina]|uniref:DUF4350 domain-containing protein n=1 Tax=Haloarcula marina TaxID=2961574 RepID=UPI0020B7B6F6|nr:DUF4350 domain-containing protein [Halomicroarcula marina]
MDWTDYPAVALVCLLVVCNLALVVAMSTSGVAYGPYNSDWDGGTDLREVVSVTGADPEIGTSTSAYVDADANEVAFVLAPTESYGPTDVTRVRQFVSRGGTLIIASERANTTNELLAGLDTETRINGTTVLDDQTNYRNATLPRATNVSEHALVTDVEALTLNRGTVLDVPEREGPVQRIERPTVLVRTTSVAYLDRNGNGALDDNETIQSYPVAAVESVGTGRVIVVSDASVFTNTMLEREGNAAFARAVSQNATTALLDYSHRPPLPPLTYALLAVRATPLAQVVIALSLLGSVALWARRPTLELAELIDGDDPPAPDRTLTEAEVVAFVRERHPDWDRERVERVSQHIIRQRQDA